MFPALRKQASILWPGLAIAGLVAMAAQFLSEHYGAPAMLMAILLGLAFQFLSEDQRMAPGIGAASKGLLRIGVALLGLRISLDMVVALGPATLVLILSGVVLTILFGLGTGRLMGKTWSFSFLAGGAVAICGASAAIAIAAILPRQAQGERDLSFTVISVTMLSTLAMIFYPVLGDGLGLSQQQTAVFLGATIHDVAQVVGAGYSVSGETGDLATMIKLIRVAMLGPVVLCAALILRRSRTADGAPTRLLPGFVVAFAVLAALNSAHLVPSEVKSLAGSISGWALLTAIAAVGMKTSIPSLLNVGGSAIALVVANTVWLVGLILTGLWLIAG